MMIIVVEEGWVFALRTQKAFQALPTKQRHKSRGWHGVH